MNFIEIKNGSKQNYELRSFDNVEDHAVQEYTSLAGEVRQDYLDWEQLQGETMNNNLNHSSPI